MKYVALTAKSTPFRQYLNGLGLTVRIDSSVQVYLVDTLGVIRTPLVIPTQSMKPRLSQLAILLLLVTFCVTSVSGCARLGRKRVCKPASPCSSSVSRAAESLPTIRFEDRQAIALSEITNPIEGFPIAVTSELEPKQSPVPPKEVRDLTIAELKRLACCAAPIAQKLESHRQWLATFERTPPAILDALAFQAQYERSKHRQLAIESYLNLTKVYSSSPILNRTDDVLDEAEKALEEFRKAGVDISGDPQELTRRRVEVTERFVELRYNQHRLNDALESLLNLTRAPSQPIWTNFQAQPQPTVPSEEEAIQQALVQRGDLLALERLAGDSQSLSVDFLRGADAGSPFIGAGFQLPGPAKWWQCLLKDEIKCLKQSAQRERQRQLAMLAENKREQIRLEVRQSLHAIEKHQASLNLKLDRIGNLRHSMSAAEKAKDIRPVEFKGRLQQRTDELKLISEIIDELIALEIEREKLNYLMGS